jgi:integrase
MRRRHGSVEQLRSGAWRARTRVDGKLVTVATVGSEKEADDALALFAEGRLEHAPVAGRTLASWGVEFLDARETGGEHRSVGRDRHVWKRVSTSKLADMPLPEITVRDIREWVATQAKTVSSKTKKRPSPQTIKNALNLLRVCLEGACQSGLIERNPARDVRAPKMARTDDAWTWLRLDELAKLLDKLSDDDRDLCTFAVYTGLRAGEVFGLEWGDVHLETRTATVRYSWGRTPTKRGKVRTIYLFDEVVSALKRQKLRTGRCAKVFPNREGQARTRDQQPTLSVWLGLAGIKRHARFHDLRHTCASHLISGSWGRAWTIEEVAQHLGHGTSVTTRRYAHLCPEGLAKAARETRPGAHTQRLPAVPRDVPRSSTEGQSMSGSALAKCLESAEEKGFEPLVRSPPRRFSKPTRLVTILAPSVDLGTVAERARAVLAKLHAGECTPAEAVAPLVDVLTAPSLLHAAIQRAVKSLDTPHAGPALVEALALVLELAPLAGVASRSGGAA